MVKKGFLIGLGLIILATLLFGFSVKKEQTFYDSLVYSRAELWTTQHNVTLDKVSTEVPSTMLNTFYNLQRDNNVVLTMTVDRITGYPSHIEGEGIPFIPGEVNSLTFDQFGFPQATTINDLPVDVVAERALNFISKYQDLFALPPENFILNKLGSGPILNYLYYIDFDAVIDGVPVENSGITFVINHGNLIQIDQINLSKGILAISTKPQITSDTAWDVLWGYVGSQTGAEEIVNKGELVLVPFSSSDVVMGENTLFGKGLSYRLCHKMSFKIENVIGTYEGYVDANTGELLTFRDANHYGHIQGGAYKTDNFPTVTTVAYPYANYQSSSYADAVGNYSGTSGTCTLSGKYVKIQSGKSASEGCNTSSTTEISLASDSNGLIDFLTSSGKDCTTPGVGGVGNTHSARTQYWNVTQIKLKALTYLSSNNWLNNQLTDYVNRYAYCNAYWDGSTLNFFKSSSGCNNLGEIPGVGLHEWGHGMDANDGIAAADYGTGETYGDFSAVLQTHLSCVGMGAFSTKCSGYGDACKTCTGVRDIDYAAHQNNTPYTPDMLDNTSGFNCRAYGYPSSYPGPCKYEGHCESLIASQALWDLAVRDIPAMGIDSITAWQIVDRLWYASRPSARASYNCPSLTGTDGSNTGSIYNIFRAVDDCDGNLSNGTPHAGAIFAALNRHKMAVGLSTDATNQNQTNCCATLSTPSLSGSSASCQNNLSWGSITNATRYKVYRNEVSCTSGYTLIGTVNSPTVTFTDTLVVPSTTYYYRVQAYTSSDACFSAMSNCVTITTSACGGGCTAPGAPTLNSATAGCSQVVLSWSAGSGTTNSYNVYRKTQTTCTGGTYTKIAGPITATTYTDTSVTAGTTYAYMVRGACDTGGTTESSDSNCLTSTPITTPTTPSAPTVTDSCTGISLSWTAISGAASYNIMRRTNGCGNNNWSEIASGITSTTYIDTTASSGTTYGYYIVAVNSCGTAGDKANCGSGSHSLSTPTAPTGLTANGSCTAIDLSWGAVTGATSYNILRTTNSNCSTGLSQIGTSATTTYSDTTATAGTTYYYVVQAVNSCGTSTNSNCANSVRSSTPTAPTGLTANGSCTAIDLSWGAVTGATSYNILRTTNSNCSTGLSQIGTSATTTYSDTTATAGTTYYYVVQAVNSCGTSGNSNCANSVRSSTPTAPTGLTATGSCTAIDLSWSSVTGATSYNILRTTNSNCSTGLSQIGTSATTTYSDTTATAGTTYYYVVQAVNSCGTSTNSNCANSVRSATPTAPTGLTANGSCTAIDLSWGVVTGATSYNVLRTTNSNCSTGLAQIGTSATTTYSDTTATAGTTYYYVVQAVNACGTSTNSNCANSVRLSTPAAPTGLTANGSCTAIDLSWGAVTGATSYNILRTTNSNCSTGLSQIGTSATTTYSDTAATAGTTYYYVVQAVNTCGTSTNSNCANSVRSATPSAPTGLTANGSCTAIDLSWGAVTGATSYNVLRTTNSNCSTGLSQIGTSATTTYSDTTATVGTTYYYVVQAVNSCGTSTNSNCANSSRVITPSAPSAPTVADISNCSLSGVSISWGSVPNATGYDLYVDGTTLIQNVTTPYTYTPGDSSSHSYQIRAKNGSCIGSWSGATSQVDQNLTPTPTISGNSTNICPDTYVTLATENGMSNYQWYLNGSPIGGATSFQYNATQSGNYTVSYTSSGCPGTSSSKSVTINPCIPNIVYSTNLSPQPVNEDGDGVMEAGEKWSMQVTVINNGNAPATNVVGSLSGEGIDVCNNPGNFGDIANGATKSYTFEFVVNSSLWYSTYPCGSSIGFDLINKSSNGYTYTDDTNFYSHQVGNVGGTTTETATAPDQTNIKNKTVTVSLTPSFTLQPTIDSATLSFALSGTVDVTSCVMVRLVSPTTQYLLLKDYGQSIASPYNVTSFYNTYGAGTYQLEITESSSCGTASQSANCTGISMSVTVGGGTTNCDTWNATCSGCLNPSSPSIDSITDNDSCSQSGVTITFTEGTPATRHDLYVDNGIKDIVQDVTSPVSYNPGDISQHSYVIRAINDTDDCYTDSTSQSFADVNDSVATAAISSVTDKDACALSGVTITWSAVTGATSYDIAFNSADNIIVEDTTLLTYDYSPGDASAHDYYVRAKNASCTGDWSTAVAGTDADNSVGTPTISSVTDADACATSGVVITWGAVSEATFYDLRVDGTTVVNNVTSPYTYTPGDNNPHNYEVRAKNASCTGSWSTAVSGTDANGTPSSISLTASDAASGSCGVLITFTGGSGATQFDLWVNGAPAVNDITSGYIYTPANENTYTYVVRGINGSCYIDSNSSAVADPDCGYVPPAPPEPDPVTPTTDKNSLSWSASAGATGYRVYKGTKDNLAALCNATADFCTAQDNSTTSYNLTGDTPADTYKCFYYLVTAYNVGGESAAGTATCGTRVVNTTGNCP